MAVLGHPPVGAAASLPLVCTICRRPPPPKSGPIRPLPARLLSFLEADLPVPNPGSTEGGRLRGPCPCCAFPWPGADQWLRQVSALTRPGPWEPPAGPRQAPSRGSGGARESAGVPGPSALSGLRLMGTLAWPWWHFLGLEDVVPPRSPRTTWWQSGGGSGASLVLRCPSLRAQRTPPWVGPHKDPAGESLASHGGGSLPHARILTEALGDSAWGSWFLSPRTC